MSSLDASFIMVNEDKTGTHSFDTEIELKSPDFPLSHPSEDSSYTPGSVDSYAHDWSSRGTGGELRIDGRNIVDAFGRVCSLRGVNLSGSCKTPVNHDNAKFPGDHRSVTFVGRPFPLAEAPEHLARLRRWGLSFIRFLVTWEAIEHAGPGIYDTDYLAYIRALLVLFPRYGLTAFVSMHQDVWSRYSGGSGAPAWTLELVGFDLHAVEDTGAAWLHGQRGGGHVEAERGLWPCGYTKLAAATMSTLFWGGDIFAPKLFIEDKRGMAVPVQQFLQNAFLDMWDEVTKAVGDLEAVIGFQLINEPHPGYINIPSLHGFEYNTDLHLSHIPTAFESFQLGAGYPTKVATWTRSFPMPTKHTSHTVLNTAGVKAWHPDGPTQGRCVWEFHDVWRWDNVAKRAVVLRENYFSGNPLTGGKIHWYDLYLPFAQKWAERVKESAPPSKLVFLEPIPNEFASPLWTQARRPKNIVFAPHWYDLNALFAKAFGNFTVNVQGLSRGMFPLKAFYWGQKGARGNFTLQIGNIVDTAYRVLGEIPVILGECGIPFDMNKKEAFRTGDFTMQGRMMDAMLTALERALVGFTLWNYNPYNSDERGDDWNGENFSWFSSSRAEELLSPLDYEQHASALDKGGRILSSVVRPYAAKTAGIPLSFEYEMNTGVFMYEWANRDPSGLTGPQAGELADAPSPQISYGINEPPLHLQNTSLRCRETEIFLPSQLTYERKVLVEGLEEGDEWTYDQLRQTLFIVTGNMNAGHKHRVHVSVDPPLRPVFHVNSLWSDFGAYFLSVFVLLASILIYLSSSAQ